MAQRYLGLAPLYALGIAMLLSVLMFLGSLVVAYWGDRQSPPWNRASAFNAPPAPSSMR